MTPTSEQQQVAQALARSVVGGSEQNAVAAITSAGCTSRIQSRDGNAYMGTCDLKSTRVNLTIVDGIVTKATTG